VLLVPSVDPGSAELVAARENGATMLLRTQRNGSELARHARDVWRFFTESPSAAADGSAPLVFSWLAGRGVHTTRLHPHHCASATHFRIQLEHLLADKDLFSERLVAISA
jgi:hypothetical protein